MMPLTMIGIGGSGKIAKVGGSSDVRRYLENLGFVQGADVKVLSSIGGNVIVNIKDSRIAINAEMVHSALANG